MGCPQYVTVVNKESLAQGSLTIYCVLQWGPQYHIQVRPQHGIPGPERSTMPCSDTYYLNTPPDVPESLCPSMALGPTGETHGPCPSQGQLVGPCGKW